jgi:hypothetical protein
MFDSSETSVITNQHGVIPYKSVIFIYAPFKPHMVLSLLLSAAEFVSNEITQCRLPWLRRSKMGIRGGRE